MTTSEQRAELVRRWRAIDPMGGGGGSEVYAAAARTLADALEASEAEKQRLIKIMREGLAGLETGPPTDAPYEIARLRVALKQAEEGP